MHHSHAPLALLSRPVITIDIDWAPDWMIDRVADMLARFGVRATWFITHLSPAVRALLTAPLFEIGLHPNFLPGSTHGTTEEEVLTKLKDWVPPAKAIRTHSLCQSERLLALMVERFGLSIDCSIHLPLAANVRPHRIRYSPSGPVLTRLPHVFQDNMYMNLEIPWSLDQPWFKEPGAKVMDFHPVHVVTNAADMRVYDSLKRVRKLGDIEPGDLPAIDPSAPGAGRLFRDVIDNLSTGGSLTVSEYIAADAAVAFA